MSGDIVARDELVELALEEPELLPRELAARLIDTKSYFVSEASVYRLLIAVPAAQGYYPKIGMKHMPSFWAISRKE